jgi:xylan 1,4-beta-xylosidase
VDDSHSNIRRAWQELDGRDAWPRDDAAWRALAERDKLDDLEPPRRIRPDAGSIEVSFPLPMPSVSMLDLVPQRSGRTAP